MTASLVRDSKLEGHWHVFVDGLEIGQIVANEKELPDSSYYASFRFVFEMNTSGHYDTLVGAYDALVKHYKTSLS